MMLDWLAAQGAVENSLWGIQQEEVVVEVESLWQIREVTAEEEAEEVRAMDKGEKMDGFPDMVLRQ